MPLRYTTQQAIQKLKESANGRYTFELTEYKNTNQKIKCKCNKCGREWDAIFKSLIKGWGCAKCSNKLKLTTQQAIQKLKESANGRYTFELTEYKNSHQTIKCNCNKCETEFYNKYYHLTNRKQGCPVCGCKSSADKRKLDLKTIKSRLEQYANGRYTFELTEYGNAKQKIKCKCNKCSYEWSATFNDLTVCNRATGCPNCARIRIGDINRLTTQQAIQKLKESANGRYTFELTEYNNNKQKIKCKCNKCGREWATAYCNLVVSGSGCHLCCHSVSKNEKIICEILSFKNLNIIENSRQIIPPKELDIYTPTHNLAIEFNGVYWHCEQQGKDKAYHLEKTQECEAKGIKLLHIFDSEWLDKREIWSSLISLSCNDGDIKLLHARKCTIKEIPNSVAKQFCNENHLQGGINSKINIGAYHESQLVAVMTFGKPRYNKNYEWELLRFCSLKFHRIRGIASRLLAHFKKGYEPTSIISYGNRRWCSSNKNVYQKMGFQLKGSSAPNYFYVKGRVLYSRLQFQKHKLRDKLEVFDETKTEYENMLLNGYDRIWDCGNLIYEWKIT